MRQGIDETAGRAGRIVQDLAARSLSCARLRRLTTRRNDKPRFGQFLIRVRSLPTAPGVRPFRAVYPVVRGCTAMHPAKA